MVINRSMAGSVEPRGGTQDERGRLSGCCRVASKKVVSDGRGGLVAKEQNPAGESRAAMSRRRWSCV